MNLIFKSQILVLAIIFAWLGGVNAQDHSFGLNPNPPSETVGQLPIQQDNPTVTTISHSTSMNVVAGSVACGYGGGITTPNSFYRAFNLPSFGITTAWTVAKVTVGVESASGPTQPVTCKLYTRVLPATFPTGFPVSYTLIGTKTLNLDAQSLTLVDFEMIAAIPANSELVVEISSVDGFATSNGFYIGSNALGQTAPSYIMADSCGISVPTPFSGIGFPNVHIVMSVTGTTELFFDNFDSYTAGQRLCTQTTNWVPWCTAPGGPEDPFVSTTYANSPLNSVKIVTGNDLVKPLGNKTTGKWYTSFNFYIPATKSGYFNQLNQYSCPATFQWGMDVFFKVGGTGNIDTTGGGSSTSGVAFNWTVGQWNQALVVVDLNTSQAEFWTGAGNLTQIATWDWTHDGADLNQIAANDFFGGAATDEMYIDNYYFSDVPPPVQQLANDAGTVSIDMATQYAPGTIVPLATVKNYGTAANTFNVQMTITGGYSSTVPVTLAAGAQTQLTFANWNPTTPGPYTIEVCTQLGTDPNATNNCKTRGVYIWDASGDWTAGAVYPITTYNGIGVSYNDGTTNYLFVMGGNTTSTLGTECYKYNVTTNTWTLIAPLPVKTVIAAGAVVGNFIYVMGGSDGVAAPNTVYYNTVRRYDIVGNTWSTVASLPITIGWGRAVAYNNYIYLAGGVDAPGATGNYLATVYRYDVIANTWTSASPMPLPVFGGGFGITGNTLVYAAGAYEDGISNTVMVGTITANPAVINWAVMDTPYPGLNVTI